MYTKLDRLLYFLLYFIPDIEHEETWYLLIRKYGTYLTRIDPGLVVAALLPLVAILPTLGNGIIAGADSVFNVHRIYSMKLMFQHGILYPRWIPYFHLGYGYPIFNFYAPGVSYLGGLFSLLGLSPETAYTLVATLAVVLGSTGTYLLGRRFFSSTAGLLAAMLWVYAPTRLFEFWQMGSLAQMMATALIPWLFWGLAQAIHHPTRRSIPYIALPLTGIIMTHQPTTFITAMVVAPAAFILPIWTARRASDTVWRRFVVVFGGLALGVGLAMIFLLPVVLELHYILAAESLPGTVDRLTRNFFLPADLFALPRPLDTTDLNPVMVSSMGLVGGLLAVLGAASLFRRKRIGLVILLLAGLMFTLYMATESSLSVWLTIPYLEQLRFPVRFLRMGTVFLALLGGASLLLLPQRWRLAGCITGMAFVMPQAMPLVAPHQNFSHWENISAADEINMEMTLHNWGSTSYGEFDPAWGDQVPYDPPDPAQYRDDPMLIPVHQLTGYEDIIVEQIDSMAVKVTTARARPVVFRQFYFPGWTAAMDGTQIEIYPESRYGLVTVDVPPGEHLITLAYTGTIAQQAGAMLTFLSIGILISLYARRGDTIDTKREVKERVSRPVSAGIIAGIVIVAFLNRLVIMPNTHWFRFESPPNAPYYMQTAVYIPFGDAFQLLGYTLEQDSVNPGGWLNITLYWQATYEISRSFRPIVQLVNLSRTEAWAVTEPVSLSPNLGGTTQGMTPDHFLSVTYKLRALEDIPPYIGLITVQLLDTENDEAQLLPDGTNSLVIGSPIRVSGADTANQPTLDYRLGDVLRLNCASLQPAGDDLVIDLYWHVLETPPRDFKTFIHGLDHAGELVVTGDRNPLNGDYPPSYWLPGQTLHDRYTLPWSDGLMSVAVGLYYPDSRERLPVTNKSQPVRDNRILLPIKAVSCE